ncbi:MAG: phosphate signaling complex protein PhoU, partial [Phycisphaerales bacterium]|nr:phosphate signaling complex protein PhoU [Phycisphaerales bacterium]
MNRLRRDVLSLSASTIQRTYDAIESLLTMDAEAARRIRDTDVEIDAMEVDVENQCIEILARMAPFAADLRYVLAAMRINSDLERIGDLAKTIAKRVIDLADRPAIAFPAQLEEMASAATAMLRNAERALAGKDESLARQVRRSDDFVDERYKSLVLWSIEQLEKGIADPQGIIDLISITRSIERIADHATNIAEDVI